MDFWRVCNEHELLRIHFEQNFETILYNCKKNNIICEGSLSITSSIYLNDEDRMKKCDTRKEERIVRSCIITEKKKIKNTRDVLSRTKSNWATYRKININLHVNVFDIARATYLIFSNNSACVINYPVQTHYPENTQITFPWTEFYSQTGRINYSPVSRDSKWLRR